MRAVLTIAKVVLAIAYPFLIYLGLTRGTPRVVGLATAAVAIVLVGSQVREAKAKDAWFVLASPLVILTLGIASALSGDSRFVLAMPVLINAVLFVQFATSLRSTPIIERFARMVETELSEGQIAHCRATTYVWCGLFVVNGTIACVLASLGRIEAWTLHTGVLSYVAMGVLGATEYVIRKVRFRRFASHPLDRILRFLIEGASRGAS